MQQLKANADFCGSLPLHLINQIQDYGVLVVINSAGIIIQVSQNIKDLLEAGPAEVCETPLDKWLNESSLKKLNDAIDSGHSKVLLTLHFLTGNEYPATLHLKDTYNLLEIELQQAPLRPFLHYYEELKQAISLVNAADSTELLCYSVISSLKRHSDFDRIMVYQFDEDWNGTVIAEVKEEGMEPYMGLRFPPSDIPRQAREMYMHTPYRLIPDRDYKPVKLYPIVNPVTNTFTDLFDCNLRSVAGVHLEYLKNMGVAASMSTRILKDGQLWGLISCHHRTAKMPNREQCALFELLSELLSARLSALEHKAYAAANKEINNRLTLFVERLYQSNNLTTALLHEEIAQQLEGGGMALTTADGIRTIGYTPRQALISMLVFWLQNRYAGNMFHTRSLITEYEEAEAFQSHGSGLLSIPIRPDKGEYLLVFRPEQIEEVAWGGDPHTALQFEADGKTYHPRASFKIWQQTVRGKSRPWTSQDLQFARELRNSINDFLLRQ